MISIHMKLVYLDAMILIVLSNKILLLCPKLLANCLCEMLAVLILGPNVFLKSPLYWTMWNRSLHANVIESWNGCLMMEWERERERSDGDFKMAPTDGVIVSRFWRHSKNSGMASNSLFQLIKTYLENVWNSHMGK